MSVPRLTAVLAQAALICEGIPGVANVYVSKAAPVGTKRLPAISIWSPADDVPARGYGVPGRRMVLEQVDLRVRIAVSKVDDPDGTIMAETDAIGAEVRSRFAANQTLNGTAKGVRYVRRRAGGDPNDGNVTVSELPFLVSVPHREGDVLQGA